MTNRTGSKYGRDPLDRTAETRKATPVMLALAVALAVACVLTGSFSHDSAEAAKTVAQQKMEELEQISAQQGSVLAAIQVQNRKINELIGEESQLRRQEASVQAVLDARQSQLDEANAEYRSQRDELRRIRARLDRAIAALEGLLVRIYKSGEQDTLSVILSSANWSDLIARAEYLQSIHSADEAVITRVSALKVQIHRIVVRLREVRARAKRARDEVARQRNKLADARAQLEAQKSELAAAKSVREQTLASLEGRQRALEKDLGQVGAPLPGQRAKLLSNGDAVAPAGAPLAVRGAIAAANRINHLPYIWGGGHGSFSDSGYDCSGAVSYALHGGGLLSSPLDSTGLEFWGSPGVGNWITVFANSGHTYAVIAGLRWDTSGTGGNGPRWSTEMRSSAGFVARHPSGL